ncbi:MAG: TRAP transporter substrate-binding protein [Opitutales bacterium]|nr:TRAP transporter substrate-binding protein [Opitutales bacterium]
MIERKASLLTVGILIGVVAASFLFTYLLRQDRLSPGRGDGVIVLRLAHVLDSGHPVHEGMVYFARRVEELSGGKVSVPIFPNGQLGSEPETMEQAQNGALALVKTSAAAMEGFVPEMATFSMPYLFRDEEHYWDVLMSELGDEFLEMGSRVGLLGICYYDSGSRSFYTARRPVLKPSDLRGQNVRVLPSRTAMDMVSTFGGSPVPVPWGELYTALQQGMVDGAENNPPSLLSSRHYEVARHYSLNEHVRLPDILVISDLIWQRLSPEVQGWVMQAARESTEFQREVWRRESDAALETLEEAGVTIYRPDIELFQEAAAPLYENIRDQRVVELVERIRNHGR